MEISESRKKFNDHYPFGSPMPTRTWSDPNAKYKYGFNGKEKDNETTVDGGAYDFGARIYDGRLGRWLSLDPRMKKGPDFSPFCYTFNNPIHFTDPDGKWPELPSLSSIKSFSKGFTSTVVGVADGLMLHNQIKSTAAFCNNVTSSLIHGDIKGAGTHVLNATGIPSIISTAKNASAGNSEAIGQLVANIAILVVVHKAGGGLNAKVQNPVKLTPLFQSKQTHHFQPKQTYYFQGKLTPCS